MYRVKCFFTDLQDDNHAYHAGDLFPREGIEAEPGRISELAGSNNKRGIPLIEAVEEKTDAKPKKGRKKNAD